MLGTWFARFRDDVPLTKAHYCESEIQNRKVTTCGRQLAEDTETDLRVDVELPRCVVCQRRFL